MPSTPGWDKTMILIAPFIFQYVINSLRPRPNRRHFADDIFKCIFENENEWISPRISLKFVPTVRINSIPALVQIMAWRRPGDKPLSEPIMVKYADAYIVTRPQWVKRKIISKTWVIYIDKNTYTLSFRNITQKLDHRTGGKWFIHRHERHRTSC